MKTESENVIHKEEKNRTDNLNNFLEFFLSSLSLALSFVAYIGGDKKKNIVCKVKISVCLQRILIKYNTTFSLTSIAKTVLVSWYM